MIRNALRGVLVLAALAAPQACQPVPSPTAPRPSATPRLVVTTTASPPSTPDLKLYLSDVTLRADAPGSSWNVFGLVRNGGTSSVLDVRLKVTLRSSSRTRLGDLVVPLAMRELAPGSTCPFAARFRVDETPSAAEAVVVGGQPARPSVTAAQAIPLRMTASADGLDVLGSVSAPSGERFQVLAIVALARDRGGSIVAVDAADSFVSPLPPGAEAPFHVVLAGAAEGDSLTVYANGRPLEALPSTPLELVETPRLSWTPQDKPFVVTAIQNKGTTARQAVVTVVVSGPEGVLGVQTLRTPTPIPPGVTWILMADRFPAGGGELEFRPTESDKLSVQVSVDPFASELAPAEPVVLEARVTGFEAVGSSVFLRGEVQNGSPSTLSRATAYLMVRAEDGRPATAGWIVAAERLAPAARAEFVLSMPIPKGVDPAFSEYDVQAFGLPLP